MVNDGRDEVMVKWVVRCDPQDSARIIDLVNEVSAYAGKAVIGQVIAWLEAGKAILIPAEYPPDM